MLANVNEEVWANFGLDNAVFLDTIAYWIKKNAANKQQHNFQDGRYWTYNTQAAFQKMFPGWSRETIRRIIRNCVKHGLLIVDNFNTKGYDRTSWFSLTDKALEYYHSLSLIMKEQPDNPDSASLVGSNQSIGGIPPSYTKTTTTTTNINISISDIVQTYHEELPQLPKVKKVDRQLKNQLSKMVKDWKSYQKDGKSFSLQSFKDYLNFVKNHFAWFLEPYKTESGGQVKCTLRKLTREINITKFINGEFSVSN